MEGRERPILFSTGMVNAILEGRKTMTRRTKGIERIEKVNGMKTLTFPATGETVTYVDAAFKSFDVQINSGMITCPYGAIGDILWVRETWGLPLGELTFKAGFNVDNPHGIEPRWKPSIHMKKIHARIWLQIADIKIERLQSISTSDAISEGITSKTEQKRSGRCTFYKDYCNRNDWYWSAKASFMSLWQKINGRESWISNPWVWVISFKVLSTTGRQADLATAGKEAIHG